MTRTLNEVIKGLPLDQQQEIEAQATRLIEEEMTLRDLRKAHELTQERMAETLRISQDGVSRIEKRSDFLLSTLRSYVEAMGGKLRLIVEFPNRYRSWLFRQPDCCLHQAPARFPRQRQTSH